MKCRKCNEEFERTSKVYLCPNCITQIRTDLNIEDEQLIRIECPKCGKSSKCRGKYVGHKARCKRCEFKYPVTEDVLVLGSKSPKRKARSIPTAQITLPVEPPHPTPAPPQIEREPEDEMPEPTGKSRNGMLLGALLVSGVTLFIAITGAMTWLLIENNSKSVADRTKETSPTVTNSDPAQRGIEIDGDRIDTEKPIDIKTDSQVASNSNKPEDNEPSALEQFLLDANEPAEVDIGELPPVVPTGPQSLNEDLVAKLKRLLTAATAEDRRSGIELLAKIRPEKNDTISSCLTANLDPEYWGEPKRRNLGFGDGKTRNVEALFQDLAPIWITDEDLGVVVSDFIERDGIGKGSTNASLVLKLLAVKAPLDLNRYGKGLQQIFRQGLSDRRNTQHERFLLTCAAIQKSYPELANPLLIPVFQKSQSLSKKALAILGCLANVGDGDSIVALIRFTDSLSPIGIERSGMRTFRSSRSGRQKLTDEIDFTIATILNRLDISNEEYEQLEKIAKGTAGPVSADAKHKADFQQLSSILPYNKYAYNVNINTESNGSWNGRIFYQVRPPLSSYFTKKNNFYVNDSVTGFVIPKNQVLIGLDRIEGATSIDVQIDGKMCPAQLHISNEKFGIAILKYVGPEVPPPKIDATPVISESDSYMWTDPVQGDLVASTIMGRSLQRSLDRDISKGITWTPFYSNHPEHNGGITLRPLGRISGFVYQTFNQRNEPTGSRSSMISKWTSTNSYISQRPSEEQLSPRSGRKIVAPISSLLSLFRDDNGKLEEGLFDLSNGPTAPVHELNDRLQDFRKHIALVRIKRPQGNGSKVSLASHADLKFTRARTAANRIGYLEGHGRDLEKQGLLEVSAIRQTGKPVNLPMLLGTLDDMFLCHYEPNKKTWQYEQRIAIAQQRGSVRINAGAYTRRNINTDEDWERVAAHRRGIETNSYRVIKEDTEQVEFEREFELVSFKAGFDSEPRNNSPRLKFTGIQKFKFNKQTMLIDESNLSGSIEVEGVATKVNVVVNRISQSETDQILLASSYRTKPPKGVKTAYQQTRLSDIDLAKLKKNLLGINAPKIRIALDKLSTVIPNQNSELSLMFANEYFARFSQFGMQNLARAWILPEHIPILIRSYQARDTEDEFHAPHQMMADFLEYHRPSKEVASEIFLAALNQERGKTDNTFRILRSNYFDIAEDVLLTFIKERKGSGFVTRRAIEALGEIGTRKSFDYLKGEAYKKPAKGERSYNGPMQQAKQKIERRIGKK